MNTIAKAGPQIDQINADLLAFIKPAVRQGKKGLRVRMSDETLHRFQSMTPEERLQVQQLASISGLDFANGVIEAEIAGAPGPGAAEGARGFVGIAFRLQNDMRTDEAFYLRPTNGRADDQERRNHAVQYISRSLVAIVHP